MPGRAAACVAGTITSKTKLHREEEGETDDDDPFESDEAEYKMKLV